MGESPLDVRSSLAASVGLAEPAELPDLRTLLDRFDPAALPNGVSVLST
jgi:hypothetical protein